MSETAFQRVIEQGIGLQRRLPELELVAVGGTAAALYCGHRYSLDVDCVTPRLSERYEATLQALEAWDGWKTNRKNPPILILGEREGTELGLRQQRRLTALQTASLRGLTVPTPEEMLRIKAFLLAERRATRDYVDVAALVDYLGTVPAVRSLSYLNLIYPGERAQTAVSRFAEACESEPGDFSVVPLSEYRGLKPPFTRWSFVSEQCRAAGRLLLKMELNDELPQSLDAAFFSGGKQL